MNTIGRPARGTIGLTLSLIVLASCATATPSDSPGGSPPASPPASVAASAELPSSSPSSAPSVPTATPGPTAKPSSLVVRWHRSADVAAPRDSWWSWAGGGRGQTWTKFGDTYVMAVDTQGYDEGPMSGPQVWLSDDLLHWKRATIAQPANQHLSVRAVTRGGPGLVALGIDVPDDVPMDMWWTSADSKTWKQVAEDDTGLTPGQRWLLHATAAGHVSYDEGAVDVTRFTGGAIASDTVAQIVEHGGDLTVFTDTAEASGPIAIWQTTGSAGWHKAGALPKSTAAVVFLVSHGPRGYFLLGCDKDCSVPMAWTSPDGVKWQAGSASTFDNVNAVVADQSGFIAVGQRVTGTGCAVSESEIFGETWTSSDGRTWRPMKDEAQFNHASIYVLIPRGRTLFGVGMRWAADHATPTVWTAALQNDSVNAGPAPSPTQTPPPGGCGD